MKRILVLLIIVASVVAPLMAQTVQRDVKLAWDTNPPTPVVTKYTVYQKAASGTYQKIADVLPTACVGGTCSYTIPAVTPGVYTYVVTASADYWGESGYSNEASTTAPATAPAHVTIQIIITIK